MVSKNNITILSVLTNDTNVSVNATPITFGTPVSASSFYIVSNVDRWVYALRAVGGAATVRLWFLYEIDSDAQTELGLLTKHIMCKQPYEITVNELTHFEGHYLTDVGAKGFYIEVTSGVADILLAPNTAKISNQ